MLDWLRDPNTQWVLAGTTLLGVSSGVLGCFALLRRRSLLGDALAYVGRVHYDRTAALHMEASYAVSEQAGGPGGRRPQAGERGQPRPLHRD